VAGFQQGLEDLASDWYGRANGELKLRKSITAIMLELLTLSRRTAIWPQRDVIKYIRSAIAIDGLIKQLAPECGVGRRQERVDAEHVRWRVLHALSSAEAIAGWLTANVHLFRDGAFRALEIVRQRAAHRRVARAGRRNGGRDSRRPGPTVVAAVWAAIVLFVGLTMGHADALRDSSLAVALAVTIALAVPPRQTGEP